MTLWPRCGWGPNGGIEFLGTTPWSSRMNGSTDSSGWFVPEPSMSNVPMRRVILPLFVAATTFLILRLDMLKLLVDGQLKITVAMKAVVASIP